MTTDPRIDSALELLMHLASGKLDARLEASAQSDDLDALITGLNMLAEELEERQSALGRNLEQTDKLAAIGQLAAGIAHEVNNPLSYMVTNLDMIAEELDVVQASIGPQRFSELQELVSEARQGAGQVRRIVRAMKVYSRMEPEQLRPIDVRGVMDVAVAMSANELRHRGRLSLDLQPVPEVLGDTAKLVQVFTNLLINAAQALPVGHSEDNEIEITSRVDEIGRVVVEVTDTGPGIPADVVDRVFDPFFTTKPLGQGTGLGLFVCHGIVTGLGGSIEVDSELGRGTRVVVTLPPADEVAIAPPVEPEPRRPTRRGRVLVVDDDPLVGKAFLRLLSREHDVSVVETGAAALALLGNGGGFDVVFCDVMMPEMTGIELFEQVPDVSPEHAERFVFVTGGAFSAATRDYLDATPNPVLEKPFDPAHVRALVRDRVAGPAREG